MNTQHETLLSRYCLSIITPFDILALDDVNLPSYWIIHVPKVFSINDEKIIMGTYHKAITVSTFLIHILVHQAEFGRIIQNNSSSTMHNTVVVQHLLNNNCPATTIVMNIPMINYSNRSSTLVNGSSHIKQNMILSLLVNLYKRTTKTLLRLSMGYSNSAL